ncbi:general stress protein [Bizionia argentinensis JUB59]|uniref:General stress protein n=1 Tax=Bizionia argentinensis JUB59 TaxID=1046627 RepID=G2EB48_9FLAO|nr:pyridoxamine 5'-phosphate oxidase family protein [Bizionia argentinensis]EGV44442.1 general stress protein [Bizionia argentinensis JUB59]
MSTRNYNKDTDGLEKIRALIDEPKIVMLATQLNKTPFSVCPMTLQQMDAQGDLWFFSSRTSGHFSDIQEDNRVQIIYTDEVKNKYLSIYGHATHIVDQKKIDELWNPALNTWFEGKEDANLALLNINMENAYYWDTSQNKLVSFFKIVDGSITDNTPDLGEKGNINMQNH